VVSVLASELLAARQQMAASLGFHIVLASIGVALPAIIYAVHRRGLRHDDPEALTLARRWSKVAAVLFAVGAVSGTILSFEMGLLWPGLMSQYGDVIGLPFALEGIAFFTEAIFLGIYLYGWDRLPPRVHLNTLIPVAVAGVFGTFCILAVNAWMNAPSGFAIVNGEVTDVDPLGAMFNRALLGQFLHMLVAAYIVTGFLVAAVYASGWLRGRRDHLHRLGITIPIVFASVATVAQPFIGHVIGLRLATEQPSKLAAMELAIETEQNAPLRIGGILVDGEVVGAVDIPGVGSLLSRGGFDRPITGLEEVPAEDWPPVTIVHLSFQLMIGIGLALVALVAWYWWRRRRHGAAHLDSRWLLRALVAAAPASVVALQAGWVVTEVGRQPWIVWQVQRVEEAVTSNGGIWFTYAALVVVYTLLGIAAYRVIRGMSRRWAAVGGSDFKTPYGPTPRHEEVPVP
jgi:cytochrome bd ubiquinol oxidase subunit I